jgi:hypothetical protein
MSTGQMMMTIGAVVLLGVTVLTVNRNNLNQGVILRQTEIGLYAVGLATSYLEKASNLDFDEATVGNNMVYATSELSTSLGYDAGETANKDSTFDDFDDYNNFNALDTTAKAQVDNFRVRASVNYVSLNSPYVIIPPPYTTATTTWLKQIDIWIIPSVGRQGIEGRSITAGVDTIKLSYIYSYYQ